MTFLLCDPGWYFHKPDVQSSGRQKELGNTSLSETDDSIHYRRSGMKLEVPEDSAKCTFSKRTLGFLEVSLGQKEKSECPSVRPSVQFMT